MELLVLIVKLSEPLVTGIGRPVGRAWRRLTGRPPADLARLLMIATCALYIGPPQTGDDHPSIAFKAVLVLCAIMVTVRWINIIGRLEEAQEEPSDVMAPVVVAARVIIVAFSGVALVSAAIGTWHAAVLVALIALALAALAAGDPGGRAIWRDVIARRWAVGAVALS